MKITAKKVAQAMESVANSKKYEYHTLKELEEILEKDGLMAVVNLNYDGKISPALYTAFYERHIDLF